MPHFLRHLFSPSSAQLMREKRENKCITDWKRQQKKDERGEFNYLLESRTEKMAKKKKKIYCVKSTRENSFSFAHPTSFLLWLNRVRPGGKMRCCTAFGYEIKSATFYLVDELSLSCRDFIHFSPCRLIAFLSSPSFLLLPPIWSTFALIVRTTHNTTYRSSTHTRTHTFISFRH